jgi:hypothetical protein
MRRNLIVVGSVLGALVLGAGRAAGQSTPPAPVQNSAPEFLFGAPHGSVGVRAAFLLAREGGDLFSFIREQLTVDKGDFNGPGVTFEFALRLTPRISAVADLDFTRSSVNSESRPYLGSDGLPIAQTSRLAQTNLAGGLKFALLSPGQHISRYAWIPTAIVPYVSAGAGTMYHRFSQQGEFVDFVDLSIFQANLESSGWAPSAYVAFGTDIRLVNQVYLSVEGKYLVAHDSLEKDFAGFDGIDLAGFRFGTGVQIAF